MIVICLLLLMFEPLISYYISFSYTDEIISLSLFVVSFFIMLRKGGKRFHKEIKYFLLVFLFFFIGILSFVFHRYQSVLQTFMSGFFSIKALLIFGSVSVIMVSNNKSDRYGFRKLYRLCSFFVYFNFCLLILNYFFKFFPIMETRFLIPTTTLYFNLPTEFAFFTVSSLLVIYIYKNNFDNKTHIFLKFFLSVIMVIASGRIKALGFITIFTICVLATTSNKITCFNKHRFSIRTLVIPFIIVFIISFPYISNYFFDSSQARNIMITTAFKIACSNILLGTGFGTFGTDISRRFYSPLYSQYGIDHVWGLSIDYPEFICDSSIPSVLAETGFLGSFVFIGILLIILNKCFNRDLDNREKMILCMIFLYLLIESVAETIFMTSRGCFLLMLFAYYVKISATKQKKIVRK